MSPSYTRDYPLVIARGEGAVVEDVDGNVFLDCAAGIAVNSTGVSHPDVVKAIADQAAKFIHMSGTDFYYEPQVRLAEELASIVPIEGSVRIVLRQLRHRGDRSGPEAVALSHEAARRHRVPRVVSRPLARALALTSSKSVQRRGFGPLMPGVYHAPYPDTYRFNGSADACAEASLSFIRQQILVHLDRARRSRRDRRRADSGRRRLHRAAQSVPPGAPRAATQHGIMLVLDEVQSGMGRTGKMFASEHFGLKGDIVNSRRALRRASRSA